MPRTNEQIGQLAFAIYNALSKVDLSHDELKSLGECLYARAPIDRVSVAAKKKLFLAARELDAAFPLPEPVVVPTPAAQAVPAFQAPVIRTVSIPVPPATPATVSDVPPPTVTSANGVQGATVEEGPRG